MIYYTKPSKPKRNFVLGLDVDETLLNPLEKYKEIINTKLGVNISVKDIEISGGLDNFFRASPIYDEFCKLADSLRASSEFNSGLPTIEGSVECLSKILELPNIVHVFYLTTRPHSVLLATEENLRAVGFPQAEIITRPPNILRENTAIWKQSVLSNLSDSSDSEIVFIDDNISTARFVCEKNKKLFKKIHMILYAGLISYTQIRAENVISDYQNGLYLADNWNQISDICYQIMI